MYANAATPWNRWVFLALTALWGLTFIYEATPLSQTTWCMWRVLTDLNCAGCGLTRSFCAMSSGDLLLALHHHPAGPLLYIGMVVGWLQAGVRWKRRDDDALKLPGRMVISYWGVVIAVFAVNLVDVMLGWPGLTY